MATEREQQAERLDDLAGYQHDGGPIDRNPNPMWRDSVNRPSIEHDEAMRMQALAIGARLSEKHRSAFTDEGEWTPAGEDIALCVAGWAYREATGREW